MIGSMGPLRRVVAVGQAVDLPGGTLIVTAIEMWEHGTILQAAEQMPEFLPPGEPIPMNRPCGGSPMTLALCMSGAAGQLWITGATTYDT